MKIKTGDLTGIALDWMVAIAEGIPPEELRVSVLGGCLFRNLRDESGNLNGRYMTGPDLLFSRKWDAAGSIIEREAPWVRESAAASPAIADLVTPDKKWFAYSSRRYNGGDYSCYYGETFLIAAMRCYVASKLGEEVDVPDELVEAK